MTESLAVWYDAERVGTLASDAGVWRFRYDASWLASPLAFALSPHFPLSGEAYADTSDDRRVQWFFDNLLPEGGVRQALAREAKLSEKDAFGLLAHYGDESAGALTFLADDGRAPANDLYEELSADELRALVQSLPETPFIAADGRARMSLAGAQHKLPLHRDGSRWLLPRGGASSVIVKPEGAAKQYSHAPANEYFCCRLADRVGVVVPPSELVHLPEPLYVVERYDRVVEDDSVRRLHQIDLCQLLNRWPGFKYESDGGVDVVMAYRALDTTRQPARSRNQFLRWFVFNYLIGNSDAHAKNISFLVSPGRIDLAPAYDLVSVRAYGDDYDSMAMSIGSEIRYGWVEIEQWDQLAASLDVPKAFLAGIRRELADTVLSAAKELVSNGAFSEDEYDLINDVLSVIGTHAGYVKKTI